MKNLKLISKRGLALFMSLVLCLGLLPVTAMAAEDDPTITIYKGEGEQEIIDALNEEFGKSSEWYYYAKIGTGTTAATVIAGGSTKCDSNEMAFHRIGSGSLVYSFTHTVKAKASLVSKEKDTKCDHSAITAMSKLGAGTHEGIKVKDADGNEYTITFVISSEARPSGKQTPTIAVKENAEPVMLVWDSKLTGVDYAAVRQAIMEQLDTDPPLTVDDVEIKYHANLTYQPLEGATLVSPISAGDQQIQIAWDGNGEYDEITQKDLALTFVDRTESVITVEPAAVEVSWIDGMADDAIKGAILDAVSTSVNGDEDAPVTVGDVDFASTDAQDVAISYAGDPTHKSTTTTVTVTLKPVETAIATEIMFTPPESMTAVEGGYTCSMNFFGMTEDMLEDMIRAGVTVTAGETEAENPEVTVTLTERTSANSTTKSYDVSIRYDGDTELDYNPSEYDFVLTVTDSRITPNVSLTAPEGGELGVKLDKEVLGTGTVNKADATAKILALAAVTPEDAALNLKLHVTYKILGKDIDTADLEWVTGTNYTVWYTWDADETYTAGETNKITVKFVKAKLPSAIVVIEDCGPVVYTNDTDALKQYVFNNAIVWADSKLPENASVGEFTYQYKTNLALIEDLNLGSFDPGSIPGLGSIDLSKLFQERWVPFEGASVKDVIADAVNDSTNGIIPGGSLGSVTDTILTKIAEALAEKMGISVEEAQELLANYPAIGAGEQTIRVAYNGNRDYAPSAYSNEAVLTITKAPAKVTVNSTVIPVKEVEEGLPGFITTEPDGVGTVTVYAGLNQNAKPVVYVDLSQADSVFKYLPKILGLEDGTNVAELYKKLTDSEITQWLEKIGISSDITGKLIDAIAGVINNDTISGIISGNKDNIADLINKGLGGVGTAIEQMGDVNVYFRAPQEPGLYGVASFVSDKNYEANPNIAVGYLVITMDAIKVTVNSTSINVGDGLPEGFITTDPHTDKVCAIYAGLPMGVWLDVPPEYWFDVSTIGELQAALNAQASIGTDAVGLDYNLVNKLLEVITRLDMPGVIDNVPVYYGVPTDTAGVYTVTAIASNNGADIPGVGVGTLTVGLNKDVTVNVANKTIYVGDEIPGDLVVTTPEDARTLVLYAGVDAGSGKLDGVVYLDGLSGAPETITIGELRQRIAGNPMLEDYRIISAILENLPETAADNWTVKTGKPPVQAGVYTVVAGAVKSGSLPAVDVGSLTIIDKDAAVIVYLAEDSNGTVRLNDQSVGGPVVFEAVPSTLEKPVGATAEVKDKDEYHFVNWTTVGLFQERNYSTTATIQPPRPTTTGIMDRLPDSLTKLFPP